MKGFKTVCKKCGEPFISFDFPVDESGIRAFTTCRKCGIENRMRTFATHGTDHPQEQPEDHQIRKLVGKAEVFTVLAILGFPGFSALLVTCDNYVPPLIVLRRTIQQSQSANSFAICLYLAAIILPGVLLAVFSYLYSRWLLTRATRLQSRRNYRLAQVEHRPPILLLRSFLENPLSRHPRRMTLSPWSDNVLTTPGDNVIKTLDGKLARFGRPVALGRPPQENPDSGQQQILFIETSHETWRQVVSVVAALSRFVLMIPGWTDGVLDEMEIIRSQQLSSRTIVYMPPAFSKTLDSKKFASEWDRVRQRCAASDFHIPPYDDRGLVYIPNPDFSICNQVPLLEVGIEWALPDAIALAIEKLLPILAGDYGTVADALISVEQTCRVALA